MSLQRFDEQSSHCLSSISLRMSRLASVIERDGTGEEQAAYIYLAAEYRRYQTGFVILPSFERYHSTEFPRGSVLRVIRTYPGIEHLIRSVVKQMNSEGTAVKIEFAKDVIPIELDI